MLRLNYNHAYTLMYIFHYLAGILVDCLIGHLLLLTPRRQIDPL